MKLLYKGVGKDWEGFYYSVADPRKRYKLGDWVEIEHKENSWHFGICLTEYFETASHFAMQALLNNSDGAILIVAVMDSDILPTPSDKPGIFQEQVRVRKALILREHKLYLRDDYLNKKRSACVKP